MMLRPLQPFVKLNEFFMTNVREVLPHLKCRQANLWNGSSSSTGPLNRSFLSPALSVDEEERSIHIGTLEMLSLFLGLLFLLLAISPSLDGRIGRMREARSEQVSASGRAEALLQEMVSESHYQQWLKCGYLEVSSPSSEKRISIISPALAARSWSMSVNAG